MMTIDDMLSEVAKITNSAPTHTPEEKNRPEPLTENAVHIDLNEIKSLKTKPYLSLSLAKEIIYCIGKGAEKFGINAVISVVNADGNLIALEAMDNSYLASIRASQDKAYTAAALKMPTHEALKESRGGIFDGLTNGNGILLLGGGYPLVAGDTLVGAIGVSGGTKDEDIMLSKLGVLYFNEKITQ